MVSALVMMLMAACFPLNGAIDHAVGGERGWTLEVDYRAWAKTQQFRVGDNLVFKYQRGDHNVIEVDETGFKDCAAKPAATVLDTGKDVIRILTTGKKWYICTVSIHCSVAGQKLEIDVLPQAHSPEASPSDMKPPPSSLANMRSVASSYVVIVLVAVAVIFC
ncbi:uncharacterized protein A4U43_C03F4650 [Asparagus officinalis]|uniref:Phytocyanin domain-containing protein n=2 Tax=Asparagus officinalis TaxID=4686 RepID=A0A5P1F7W8_ASPOF|nr:uncharacterized protein A4U43_C03F4650 [Asparagus officinalis]